MSEARHIAMLPPPEFRRKMKWVAKSMKIEAPDAADNPHTQFTEAVYLTDEKMPSSLGFLDARDRMSEEAQSAMKVLHEQLLGDTFGKYEGEYGAGGGGIHAFYLGRGGGEGFPSISELLSMLRLADQFKPPAMAWRTTLDPMFQVLFGRTPESAAGQYTEDGKGLMQRFYELLDGKSGIQARVHDKFKVPPRVTQEFIFLTEARVLFLMPKYNLHDGTCTDSDPAKIAFDEIQKKEEADNKPDENRTYWCDFLRSDALHEIDLQHGVSAEEAEGKAQKAGDIYECPCFALFQLEKTGEVLGLAQWDYRD